MARKAKAKSEGRHARHERAEGKLLHKLEAMNKKERGGRHHGGRKHHGGHKKK